jgi:hypothetical protein
MADESGAVGLAATRLSGRHVLLTALDKALDRLAAIPNACADLHKIRWLPEESAASDRRDGNLQKLGHLVFG